jgi:hypothetical protein
MTDETNPGTAGNQGSPDGSTTLPDTTTQIFEPVEAGTSAPAQAVARDPGTGEPPATRRSSGLRWAIALVGVAVIVGATAIIVALASGRPSPSIAVGYMPTDTVSYGEYRLDLPGDQRAKMAAFLGKFPGFDDPSNAQAKLYEVFDRIIRLASKDKQSYTANIEPWFGGQIAMGSGPISATGQSSTGASPLGGGSPLFVVTVKDKAKATDWLKSTIGESLTETAYNGTTIYGFGGGGADGFAVIVTDKVMLLGTDTAVRAAFDSNGAGKLADDAEFKAAFGTVSRDYVSFSYTEFRGLLQSIVSMGGAGSGLDTTTVDDELLSMVPAWQASSLLFEDDALVGDGAYPRIDLGFDAKNRKSSLVGHAPPGTIFYAESHDIGPALNALLERLRKMPDLREPFKQIDAAVGVAGGFDGLFGWWGDAAVAISKGTDGSIGGGLLIQPTDAAAAKRTFDTLRSFLLLAGGNSGIELRDVDHGGATITVIDFSAAAKSSGQLPAGVKAELAYTVTNDVVVIGYGEAFVASVLDAGPGPSLADDSRFTELVSRAGQENIGLSFINIRAIRELVEPLVKDLVPADKWAFYEKEIRPYVLPFDAIASGVRVDGDLDRLTQIVTVKEAGN